MGDENVDLTKTGDQGKDTVSKADFDTKVAELTKTQQELEDMRLEVFSSDYMEFLDAKDKGKGKDEGSKEKAEAGLKDEDVEKLSKKEILEKARALAKEDLKVEIEAAKKDAVSTVDKERRASEVTAFARTHDDFEKYRPVMYGLSLDPKNKDHTLQELYDASKDYIKRNAEPSEEEKKRQASMSTEKPGGDTQAFEAKYKKMSPDETAKESLQEVKDKFGPIPTI